MTEPTPGYLGQVWGAGLRWPLSYETDAAEVPPHRGTLDGVYYLDGREVRCATCLD